MFQAIADPTRRQLLELLGRGDLTVQEMAERFDVTLSAISQHLRVLRFASLVVEERQGRHRVYRLNPDALVDLQQWAQRSLEAFWNRKLNVLGNELRRRR